MRLYISILFNKQSEELKNNRAYLTHQGADVDSLLKRINEARVILRELCDSNDKAAFMKLSQEFNDIFSPITEEFYKYEQMAGF